MPSIVVMATSYFIVLAVMKLFRVKNRNARIALLLVPLYKSLMILLVGTPQIVLNRPLRILISFKFPNVDYFTPWHRTPDRWLPTLEAMNPIDVPWIRLDSIVNVVSILVVLAVLGIVTYKLTHFLVFYRHVSQHPDSSGLPPLKDKVTRASALMGIRPPKVVVIDSPNTFVPFTMGLRQPVVVMPGRLLDEEFLPAVELESVLAHEFAHIKRRDYLLNWVFSIVGSLLYYTPLTKKLLLRAYEAAEEACDELAAKTTGQPQALVDALVHIAKATVPSPGQPELAQTFVPVGVQAQTNAFMSGKQLEERILHLEHAMLACPSDNLRTLKRFGLVLFIVTFCITQLNLGTSLGMHALLFQ